MERYVISRKHSNRRPYNWLAYDVCDRLLMKHTDLYKGRLYDLGSGESPLREFFLRYADEYIGVDWAKSLHETKTDITADLNRPLPIETESADTIVCLSVLEHLREPQVMLNEAFRILRNGGAIVLQVPWQWWIHEAPYDYYRYTPYGLEYLLRRAGFVDTSVEPQAGIVTTITLKLNYFSFRFIRGGQWMRTVLTGMLSPFWYMGQKVAPLLDRLDRDWACETCGYFVTARKP